MDSHPPERKDQQDERIASLINEYFDRKESGEALTPDSFAGEHPDLAVDLQPYLEGLSLLDIVRSAAGVADTVDQTGALPPVPGYELLEEIGRGGMGVVYRALQVATKREVALKVMLAGPFASQAALRRFEREVELAARLQHPGIVRILESGTVARQKYYAMDLVRGVRLSRFIASERPGPRTILQILERICRAVDYAHNHGVIHRDLKPANVLIDRDGHPHILDFGLAKATDQGDADEPLTTCLSAAGQIMGTLPYLSPEQAAGKTDQIHARTDVYALGVVMFEALTGSLPLEASGRATDILAQIIDAPPPRPSSLSTRADREVDTIVLKALQKNPADRYQSAGEMAEDIGRYLSGEPILARQPSSFYVVRKKLVKHRLRVALIAVVALVAVAAVVSEVQTRRSEHNKARIEALTIQQRLEEGDVAGNLARANALMKRHPKLVEARLVFAQAKFRTKDLFGEALRILEQGLQLDVPQWAFRALLAELHRAGGESAQADRLQAEADRLAPQTAEGFYIRSFATIHVDNALNFAQKAVEQNARHVTAWQRLSQLRLLTGDTAGAMQAADELIRRGDNPNNWRIFKGTILARQNRFSDAIAIFTEVVNQPRGAATSGYVRTAHLYRAHVNRRLHKYAEALEDLAAVAEFARGDPGAMQWMLYQRATVLWMLGRTAEAIEDCRQFRVRYGQPFYSDARLFLILREEGRREEADEILRVARDQVKEPWLGNILACLAGDLTAEQLVHAASEDREHLCEAYYYAGESCLQSNQIDQAKAWFNRCVTTGLDFDPTSSALSPMNEYDLAEWRLVSLQESDSS